MCHELKIRTLYLNTGLDEIYSEIKYYTLDIICSGKKIREVKLMYVIYLPV